MVSRYENEFSRRYPADRIQARSQVIELKAKPEECAALARRFDLVELNNLSAVLNLEPKGKGSLLLVTGQLKADVIQACAVSAEPIISSLDESFEILYSFDPVDEAGDEILIDMDAEDPPEMVELQGIDFGEAVAQQLAVMLDPYPRKSGVSWDGESVDEAPDEEKAPQTEKHNPFSVLKDLQSKK
ncbi:DUF177 domain-containing protein [Kiloniella laminariae]|uniref:DUF177 domain-containing protein n=1 Tax=Kiloniella laminariae TaxID=454162 RepID=A0ABT4LGA3_9PROT|nr:DUF177 domain-containing protein [Kiloniella laminariae]MCZ4280130.1 DUF177 domain-containing protein [Kiloniella laminariae]